MQHMCLLSKQFSIGKFNQDCLNQDINLSDTHHRLYYISPQMPFLFIPFFSFASPIHFVITTYQQKRNSSKLAKRKQCLEKAVLNMMNLVLFVYLSLHFQLSWDSMKWNEATLINNLKFCCKEYSIKETLRAMVRLSPSHSLISPGAYGILIMTMKTHVPSLLFKGNS